MSRAISASIDKGRKSHRFQYTPTYSINLINFELSEFKQTDDDCLRAFFYKDEKNRILTKKNGIFYLNLLNYATHQLGVSAECKKWLYMIRNMQHFTEQDYQHESGIFKELMDECRINKLEPSEMEKYNKSVLEYEEVKNAVAYADESAYKRGKREGKMEGILEGKLEEKIDIARNLFRMGIDKATICTSTGLTEAELDNIEMN